MTIFVLDGKGFLGSAILRRCAELGIPCCSIGKSEYSDYRGRQCDVLINANGNSRKYLALDSPLDDFEMNVASVRRTLEDFRFGKYILLSSADVYPDSSSPETTGESLELDPALQSRYGFHKYLAELCVRHRAPHWLILRLSGFVGPGLRKNAVYDVLNGNPVWVSPDSEFQYLHTRDLASIVLQLAGNDATDRQTINVGAEGTISVAEVARLAGCPLQVRPGSQSIRCELSLERLHRLCLVPATFDCVREFLQQCRSEAE